jgi:hypothetical protein
MRVPLTLLALASWSAAAQTHQTVSKMETKTEQLPITRVALYKNGVGFFEHAGRVQGDQSVTIDFTSAQLNDVLQSLTAIDLNGGRISGASYNSTTPLDQRQEEGRRRRHLRRRLRCPALRHRHLRLRPGENP